jgi:hypothetical protein
MDMMESSNLTRVLKKNPSPDSLLQDSFMGQPTYNHNLSSTN